MQRGGDWVGVRLPASQMYIQSVGALDECDHFMNR
jgi:hypothetical protein